MKLCKFWLKTEISKWQILQIYISQAPISAKYGDKYAPELWGSGSRKLLANVFTTQFLIFKELWIYFDYAEISENRNLQIYKSQRLSGQIGR